MSLLRQLIDDYYNARESRRAADKHAEELKAVESQLKAQVLEALANENLTGASGTYVNFSIKEQMEPTVRDWEQVHEYVVQHDAWDLMYKRVNAAAVKERWDAEQTVPGVDAYPVTKVSVTKVK